MKPFGAGRSWAGLSGFARQDVKNSAADGAAAVLRLVAARATQRKATDENEAESEEREGVVLGEDVGAVGEGVGVHELEDAVGKSG